MNRALILLGLVFVFLLSASSATADEYPTSTFYSFAAVEVGADGLDQSEEYSVPFTFKSDDGVRSVAGTMAYDPQDNPDVTGNVLYKNTTYSITRGHPGVFSFKLVEADDKTKTPIETSVGPAMGSYHIP